MSTAKTTSDPDIAGDAPSGSRAPKNLLVLGVAKVATAVSSLVLAAYLTRVLGPSGYGILGFGTALLTYFLLFVRLGFKQLGAREVARAPEKAKAFVNQFLWMQLILACIGFAAFCAVVYALPKSDQFKTVLIVQGASLFASAISLEWLFQGLERMTILAVCRIVASVFRLVGVLVLVTSPDDIVWAAAMYSTELAVFSGLLLIAFIKRFGLTTPSVGLSIWKKHLPVAIPIATSTFMVAIYFSIDQVLLGFLRTETEVGLYTASIKAVAAIQMPAMVLIQVFFPILSKAIGNISEMRESALQLAKRMLPIGFGIGIIAAILSNELIVLFAGETFEPAKTAFMLLMCNATLIYLTMTIGQTLLAWDKQNTYMIIVGAGAILNVLLNIIVIPNYGIEGAASTTIATELVVLAGLLIVHIRMVGFAYRSLLIRCVSAAILGIGLPAALIIPLGLPVLVSGTILLATYAVAAFAFGLVRQFFQFS